MTWPQYIHTVFDGVQPPGRYKEDEYYGPYNTLLSTLFSSEENFFIFPQHQRTPYPRSVDPPTIIFVVRFHQRPVMFLNMKVPDYIRGIGDRTDADEQMRDTIRYFANEIAIPTLYGVSAIGTRICVYTYDTASNVICPHGIEKKLSFINDTAPAGRWALDVMTPEGEQRLREVVTHIKTMCAQL